jgi:hypothetical protein
LAGRVTVVYPGVAPRFRPLPPEQTDSAGGWACRNAVLLSLRRPRKNLVGCWGVRPSIAD